MTLWKDDRVCDSSYTLFRRIMPTVNLDNWYWHPAWLSFRGAFGWDSSLPPVGDPGEMLDFLERSLVIQESGINQDELIERVFCALAFSADEGVWRRIHGIVDFSQPLFVNGLRHALRSGAPYLLKRSTVFILPSLDGRLFRSNINPGVLPDPASAKSIVTGWSSAVMEALKKNATDHLKWSAVTTLFSFMDSPFWREYIPPERLSILEYASVIRNEVPDPFRRCLQNPDILPYLKMKDKGMSILWVLIQWVNYPHLSDRAKTELEGSATVEAWAGGRRGDPASFISIMDGEVARLEQELQAYDAWSFEPRVLWLRANLDDLRGARSKLVKIKKSFE